MTEIDLLTPIERKRKERNENIIAEFKELILQLRHLCHRLATHSIPRAVLQHSMVDAGESL